MKRRKFITLLGGTAAWPLAAHAQQRAMPVIGLLSGRSPAVDMPLIAIIRQGLNETGFVEGQNVALDYRWADGQYDRLAGLAADLVRQQVAVIVTIGGEVSALAAKAATATIPIVFAGGSDPIRSGLATSLHRPGGNSTGVSTFIVEMEAKRLGLLRELRPHATTTAALVNPANIHQAEMQVSDIQTASRSVGQEIMILNASAIRDIDAAFARLVQMHADALLVAADPFFFNRAVQLVVLAARHAIPTLYSRRVRRSGRAHELWIKYRRELSPTRHLRRPDTEGRKTRRSADPTSNQVRTGGQSQHRKGTRTGSPTDPARPRRRGDRVKRREFIAILAGAAATWPLAGRAQPPQQPMMPVIRFLSVTRTSNQDQGQALGWML